MTPINKGIGVLALSLVSGMAFAQDPGVATQDITSKIAVSDVDGFTAVQQVASPFGSPVLIEGDDVLYQGLFGALVGSTSSGSVGIGSIFSDDAAYEIVFDAAVKTLGVKIPAGETAKIFIVDMAGQTVLAQATNDEVTTIDLSSFAPGVYMAGAASDNKFSKTLKFILK